MSPQSYFVLVAKRSSDDGSTAVRTRLQSSQRLCQTNRCRSHGDLHALRCSRVLSVRIAFRAPCRCEWTLANLGMSSPPLRTSASLPDDPSECSLRTASDT